MEGKAIKRTEVVDRITSLIETGLLRGGDRIPSIRNLADELSVSINTVRDAYVELEKLRIIESRPQSGFFVRMRRAPVPEQRKPDPAQLNPLEVSMCRIYYGLLHDKPIPEKQAYLAIAEPDPELLPVKRLADCLIDSVRSGPSHLEYAMSPGYLPLREEISHVAANGGVSLSSDEIIVTAGASEAVTLAVLSLCRMGDTIAVETPLYFNFLQLLERLGIRVIEIPSSPVEGMHLETLQFVLERYPVKAVLCIPTFSNPLGSLMPESRKAELVRLAELHDIPLIEDDVYGDLYFSGSRPRFCKSFDTAGRVILCSSFSKTLAPGYRIGWISPGRYYDQIDKMKSLTSVATSAPVQHAVSRYLSSGNYERHLRQLRQACAHQVGEMHSTISWYFPEGTRITRPTGGFVLWVELPSGCDTLELYRQSMKERIPFAPGIIFSASGGYSNCLRLNAGLWNEETRISVQRLGILAGEMVKKKAAALAAAR